MDNFKKRHSGDSRKRYLRYDDVFMSAEPAERRVDQRYEPRPKPSSRQMNYAETRVKYDDDFEDADPYGGPEPLAPEPPPEYFSPKSNIIDEKMVRYQKRQLPPLQRYTPNQHRDMYAEFNKSYWDDEYDYKRMGRQQPQFAFLNIWQKFIITFASMLSLICLSWIIYNWNSGKDGSQIADGPILIEPQQPSFKVLPDEPGGAAIPHKEKLVYERFGHGGQQQDREMEERLLPPPEAPPEPMQKMAEVDRERPEMESTVGFQDGVYSIVDNTEYYVKISAGGDQNTLLKEAGSLRKKFHSLLLGKECSVKTVRNSNSGKEENAILVGPFTSKSSAICVAEKFNMQCYVISVKPE
ncbi:MAG: hypothetical protein LBJ69_01080 [Holosporales bacterium]|nr:hypothetical protein [Holosporales bacterium]